MQKLLNDCLENVEGEYAGVGHPAWWKEGEQAGRLNSGALTKVVQDMTRALNRVGMTASVEI